MYSGVNTPSLRSGKAFLFLVSISLFRWLSEPHDRTTSFRCSITHGSLWVRTFDNFIGYSAFFFLCFRDTRKWSCAFHTNTIHARPSMRRRDGKSRWGLLVENLKSMHTGDGAGRKLSSTFTFTFTYISYIHFWTKAVFTALARHGRESSRIGNERWPTAHTTWVLASPGPNYILFTPRYWMILGNTPTHREVGKQCMRPS
jgi:hypothetical protein